MAAQLADIRGNIGIGIWNFQREVRGGLRALFSRAIIASFATRKATERRYGGRERKRDFRGIRDANDKGGVSGRSRRAREVSARGYMEGKEGERERVAYVVSTSE